jgi:RimJ/RimL family protein N-acetyltransferase
MLSLPVGYWRFLEDALGWSRHGCLVLARAEGWSSLAEIREDSAQGLAPRADSPPVNFHWLAKHLPRIGATAHTVRACRTDAIQLVASGGAPDAAGLQALCRPLASAADSSRADRARAVRVLAAGGELKAALAVLQSSMHDPALLRAAWPAIVAAAASVSHGVRAEIAAWVERVMTDNPWIVDDLELLRATGHVALACDRFDLAQAAVRAMDETGSAVAADLVALARCREQVGQFDAALAACDKALSRHPGHAPAQAARERIEARAAMLSGSWRVQHGHAESPLLLDPLHADHAPMLLRQMRDPSIPAMTALPVIAQGDDGRGWIQARLVDTPAAYAIVHRRLGFVGYLDLRLWQGTAFVCYWIGPDFQGRGFCGPALALGCELAARNGVDLLLSSAYDDNMRSLRVLFKHGFRAMTVRAVPPDSERTFVMLPAADMDDREARRRLIEFCDNTASGLRFVPDEGDAHAPAPPQPTMPGTDRHADTSGEMHESQ